MPRERTDRTSLVTVYNIRPGNGAGLFFQPQSPHGALPSSVAVAKYRMV